MLNYEPLTDLCSSGVSGPLICVSSDDEFIIKMVVQHKEAVPAEAASWKEQAKPLRNFEDLDFLQDMPDVLFLDAAMYKVLVLESIQGKAGRGGTMETNDHTGGMDPCNSKGERLPFHIGITDILQSYRFVKKLEYSWKALENTMFKKIPPEALSFQKVSVWLIFFSASRPQRQLLHYLPALVPEEHRTQVTTKKEVEPDCHLGHPDVLPQTLPVEEVSEDSPVSSPGFSSVVGETLQVLTTSSALENLEIAEEEFPQ
ncbi:Phosphatidylinositol-4-phosphate 5-kinase type-1 alpha [Heterocephalus glaber]|uniref:Phosphatidylinositol-4-phosphate 5-kinase type-1 alpha n=1 Tax=Heterocephalus glaber TaxID=10181 RepID=G5BCP4_HETGA|nr:Phosphatidylinositol-4-phosphate 5-kinase type-1 alpha [Heterocephalus glaber]